MDLINGFDRVSPGSVRIRQPGRTRLGGYYTLVVSEYLGSGSDPSIRLDQENGCYTFKWYQSIPILFGTANQIGSKKGVLQVFFM